MRKFVLAISVLALSATTALAQQQSDMPPYTPDPGPRQGDWEAFIGGSGGSRDKFDSNVFGVTGSIGYYALQWLPISLRQGYDAAFGDDVDDQHRLSTSIGVDLQAPLGRFQPFIGGFVGGQYGWDTNSSGFAGPEAGIKYYVNESTFLSGLFQYQFLFDESWDDGNALYTIGFGFNF